MSMRMDSSKKKSFFYCNACYRTFNHDTYRYNCTICSNYDQCSECTATVNPAHPHPLVPELAFGNGEYKICPGRSMGATIYTAMEIYCDRHCLGVRDVDKDNPESYFDSYSWLTYKDVGDRATNFGHGLRQLIEPRDYLGICAASRPEWVMTDWACMFHSMISVPINTLSSDHDTTFIINNTKIAIIVCDKKMLPKFVRLHSECPSLRHIVCMDLIPESIMSKHISLSVHYMNDIEKLGSRQQYPDVITQPTDCLTIIYTSGSSGFPKGVMISDSAFRSLFPKELSPSTGEYIVLSYHPLAWYGGRNNLFATFLRGGRAGFSTGNASRLMEELALIRPTMFSAPPHIWNTIYSEFKTVLSSIKTGDPSKDRQKEEELLQQFSKLIPSRCESIAIVGALISPIVLDFLERCFRHCRIKDGYGITECGRVAFNNSLDASVVYRLESVPEMGFTTNDKPFSRGELLIKTAQMFSGYVNNPTETQAALTDDGFFRTGDIVELRPVPLKPPQIYIIDRRKNFFKLAQGQFVSPEYLQGVFTQSSFIEQIYIHGDLLDDCVTAVVVPNRERAQAFAIDNNIELLDSDPKFSDAIKRDLRSIGLKGSLRNHEIPSRIIIEFESFTVENGLLTSSMKPCRPKLAEKYTNRLKQQTNSIEKRLKMIIETVTGQSLETDGEVSFLAAGGNSLTAVRLSQMIRDNLGVTVPLSVLFEPEMNLRRLTEFAQDPSCMKEESIVDRLLRDTEIDFNEIIGKPKKVISPPSTIFITGATGFVGAFLLFEMLHKYPIDSKFICLVRCQPSVDPMDRIRENLIFLCLWQDEFLPRIVPLRGDLAQIRFGLDEKTYAALADQTDIIFACGATVNLVLPYTQLYGSNVCGAREIIRLASHTSYCIPIQYISTISVLPPGIVHEIHIDQISPNGLTNGYGQSKWVAEKLMAKANRSGLPVAIYRLGSMGGHSKTGACNALDINTLIVAATLKMNCYPMEVLDTKLNTLPIDFAVKTIIHLSLFRPDVYGSVYHVVHPDGGVPFQNVITNAYNRGIKMVSIPFQQWRTQLMQETLRGRSFESLSAISVDNLFIKYSILSSEQFYRIVSRLNIPTMDNNYANKWLTFILQNIVD